MDCDWDGSCYEAVMLETCDCKNAAVYTSTQYNFKVRFENFQNLTIQFSLKMIGLQLFYCLNSFINNRMERLQQQLENRRRDNQLIQS